MKNTNHIRGTTLSFNKDLIQLNQIVLMSMRLKDKSNVAKAWSFEGKFYLKNKAGKTEVAPYSSYQKWQDLKWPE